MPVSTHSKTNTPLPALLLLLSVSTGLIDAVSVLGLGKVFTANMTGNVVFLGFAAAGTPGFKVLPYVAAIASFLVGALAAGRTGELFAGKPLRVWLMSAAATEAALFWIAAAVAVDFDVIAQSPSWRLYSIIALTGLGMGFRNATIRRLKVPDLTTTVLTLTITGLAADSAIAGGANPNWGRRVSAVLALFVGAVIGAALVKSAGLPLPLLISGILALAGTLAFALHPSARFPADG